VLQSQPKAGAQRVAGTGKAVEQMDWIWIIEALLCAIALFSGPYDDAFKQLADWIDPPEPEPTPIDEVHQAYYEDRIDEAELDRRLEVLLDDRARTIQDMTDDTKGIGEELSRDLAQEFDTVADLKAADSDDFRELDGIGETKAERLHDTLS